MRASLYLWVFVCLFSASAVSAQRVIEEESTARLEGSELVVRLAAEGGEGRESAAARLELVDASDKIVSAAASTLQFSAEVRTHEFRLPVGEALRRGDAELIWHRLRYRVGKSAGIMSLSQMLKDLFELHVTATENVLAGMKYRVRVRAVNPFTWAPARGVKLEAKAVFDLKGDDDRKLVLATTGETDAEGFALLDMDVPARAELNDDGDLTVTGRRDGIEREAEQDLNALGSDVQAITMTDKPIYQPGQTLNVRAILLKGGEGAVALPNAEMEFRIEDEEGTLLYREKTQTSEFGVAAVSWRVPANAMLGDYRVLVRDRYEGEITSQQVKVTRYDLPNFAVNAKPSKPYYLPADKEAEIEIRADYLFGKPVARGKVRVVEEKSRGWNWKQQRYDIDEGEVSEGETDVDGKFIARFDLSDTHEDLKDDRWDRYEDIKFAAYFTDPTTNKTEQRRFDVRVSREPIHVYLIKPYDFGNARLPLVGYVSTFYADGTPAKCDVELKASADGKDRFKTYAKVKTNSLGAGKFVIPRPGIGDPADALDFRIVANDRRGGRGTANDDVYFQDDSEGLRVFTDKSIYKPGETVEVRLRSTRTSGIAYVDVVSGWSAIGSFAARLDRGEAKLRIPYQPGFRGDLKVAAYMDGPGENDELITGGRGIIFPAKGGLQVQAEFDKPIYKPNEEASVQLGVVDAIGRSVESALGVVIFDKAVEERARTDADFGGMNRGLASWLGYGKGFGGINIKHLNDLDLAKPIPDELQSAAEIMLHDARYRPDRFRSRREHVEAASVFRVRMGGQFDQIRAALSHAYLNRDHAHPIDDRSLTDILGGYGLDVATIRDPWGTPYRAEYDVEKTRDILRFVSAGPDKTAGTHDDLTAFSDGWDNLSHTRRAIESALNGRHAHLAGLSGDAEKLTVALGLKERMDRFGRPYRVMASAEGRSLRIRVVSAGKDGKFAPADSYYGYYYGDDFEAWSSLIDYFSPTERRITEIQRTLKNAPLTEAEFRRSLEEGGVDVGKLRDGGGMPLYISVSQRSRTWERVSVETVQVYGDPRATERSVVTPVTQQVVEFSIRGPGRDRRPGTYDDVTFTQYAHLLAEQAKDAPRLASSGIQSIVYDANAGAIAGVVTDPQGAVVPGATVTATNSETSVSRAVTTSDEGKFLIASLAAGKYSVRVDAPAFKSYVVNGVLVVAGGTANLTIPMDVGAVSEVVSVMSEEVLVDSTSASVGNTVNASRIESLPLNGRSFSQLIALKPGTAVDGAKPGNGKYPKTTDEPNSTPLVREYFPETLLWQPEIVTNADGRAEVKFRMADNITTWKMYTIASTRDGKVGFAEKEATAFQSFFVDLDPPKFLTAGDEIHLPTQLRNYTDKRQNVDVTMTPADWFTLIDGDRKQVAVDAGQSENAVFGFRATTPVNDGKQRVTAAAQTDSDAIERPVTVRPNGHEHVGTETRYIAGAVAFNVDLPANALREGRTAELRIYPNQFAHVTEAVEGLLQRPYGCGEQTVSSSYPNVMILKFARTGRIPEAIERKARKYLASGYERLIGYQVAEGGFSYWGGKDQPDLALTAYALRFLADASEFIAVDSEAVRRAEDWLIAQQRSDGSWLKRYRWETVEDPSRAESTTTFVARTLAMLKARPAVQGKTEPRFTAALTRGLSYLRVRNAGIDDAYSLSLLGLAALDAGDETLAREIARRLATLAKEEGGGAFWDLESSTAFNGWGSAGRIETTALATQLFLRLKAEAPLTGRAMLFLLKHKDRYGVWYSTQTTVNVLDAFVISSASGDKGGPRSVEVLVNGRAVQRVEIGPENLDRIVIDIAPHLADGRNSVELRSGAGSPMMAQVVAGHYIPWSDAEATGLTANATRALRLDYKCGRTVAAIMEEVACTVETQRVGNAGSGMLLAEIGTPPGADVSRESLQAAMDADWSISKYDVLPDRVRLYMWSRAGGTKFTFKFRPRYGIDALTPASVVYDYYNPEAQAVARPIRFQVK